MARCRGLARGKRGRWGLSSRGLALLCLLHPVGLLLAEHSAPLSPIVAAWFRDASALPATTAETERLKPSPIAPPYWIPHPAVEIAKQLMHMNPHMAEVCPAKSQERGYATQVLEVERAVNLL